MQHLPTCGVDGSLEREPWRSVRPLGNYIDELAKREEKEKMERIIQCTEILIFFKKKLASGGWTGLIILVLFSYA